MLVTCDDVNWHILTQQLLRNFSHHLKIFLQVPVHYHLLLTSFYSVLL